MKTNVVGDQEYGVKFVRGLACLMLAVVPKYGVANDIQVGAQILSIPVWAAIKAECHGSVTQVQCGSRTVRRDYVLELRRDIREDKLRTFLASGWAIFWSAGLLAPMAASGAYDAYEYRNAMVRIKSQRIDREEPSANADYEAFFNGMPLISGRLSKQGTVTFKLEQKGIITLWIFDNKRGLSSKIDYLVR